MHSSFPRGFVAHAEEFCLLKMQWGRETPKSRTFRRRLARAESRANNSLIDGQSTVPGHSGRFFKAFSAF
ncbi:hypothetical protein LCM4579_01590 [Ensifer sp. LCM 4579]|nr:hypothetical protein LCM4579_01590 [Ensifer sp. LCM 4579]